MTADLQARVFARARTDTFVFSPVRGRIRAKSFELVLPARACISMEMKIPEPTHTTVTSEAALFDWFETAQPGERVTYHIGHLAVDRAREATGLATGTREGLGRLADRVMALVGQDMLIAVQQRLDADRMAYLAIKVRHGRRGDRSAMTVRPAPDDVLHMALARPRHNTCIQGAA